MAIIAYFGDNLEAFPSDSDRQEWATWLLEDKRYIYRQSEDDDPSVSNSSSYHLLSAYDGI